MIRLTYRCFHWHRGRIIASILASAMISLYSSTASGMDMDLECPDIRISHPVWSPNGSYIAFLSNVSGDYELYLYDFHSSSIERLTENPGFEGSVSWSPDSSKIAFWGQFSSDVDFEGYSLNLKDKSLKQIVRNPGNDFDMDWSPDGGRIAFQSERHGNRELYELEIATESVRRLTSNEAEDLTPDWSPSGHLLAFSSSRTGDRKVHFLDLRTGSVTVLENQPKGANYFPIWSPDGDQLLINTSMDDSYSLYHADLESGEVSMLASPVSSGPASWSPDGRAVVYSMLNGTASHIRRFYFDSRDSEILVTCAAMRNITNISQP